VRACALSRTAPSLAWSYLPPLLVIIPNVSSGINIRKPLFPMLVG
jgi:hypothetical protein